MSDDVAIRTATEADVSEIVEIWKEMIDFHAERDPWFTRAGDGHHHFARWLRERIRDRRSVVVVAEKGGRVAGYCLAMVTACLPVFAAEEYGSIMDISVGAGDRRQGIGTRLYRETRRRLKALGVRRLELRAALANDLSTAFWRKMGFKPFLEALYDEL